MCKGLKSVSFLGILKEGVNMENQLEKQRIDRDVGFLLIFFWGFND
jgi:hypothetical protein